MKIIKILLVIIGTVYIVGCSILYIKQEQLLFLLDSLPEDHVYRKGEEVKVEVDNDVHLSCWYSKMNSSKGVILYWHGNKGNIRRCIRQADMMADLGYDIFMPDYRGYGKSEGHIYSEEQLQKDAQKVYNHLISIYKPTEIIVVGYSMGSGVATYLAANNPVQQLILLTPYVSLVDMKNRFAWFVPDFLLKYKMDNASKLASISCPVTLFHGTSDELIPFNSSERLQILNPSNIELIPLPNESHRGAIFNQVFRKTLKERL